jgi:hypothetical protein
LQRRWRSLAAILLIDRASWSPVVVSRFIGRLIGITRLSILWERSLVVRMVGAGNLAPSRWATATSETIHRTYA